MNILITTGIFPPDVGGPAKFVPLIANKLSENHTLKIITLSEEAAKTKNYSSPIYWMEIFTKSKVKNN